MACAPQIFTGSAAVTLPCSLAPNVVDNSKLATAPAYTIKGNSTGSQAGLADLQTSQVVNILAATGPQVAQGASGVVLTPANFVAAGQSLGSSGYVTLPGGLILMWGYYPGPITNGSTYTVSFSPAFPSGCFSVSGGIDLNGATGGGYPYVLAPSSGCGANAATFKALGYQSGSGGSAAGFYWLALGH